jgi:hypothetical protein
MNNLNGVMIIPTGMGCKLGGDAAYTPGVKLIASCTQNLIVNPNSVNASDVNELPGNALYVEGSTIDRFMWGKVNLRKTKTLNRILMVVNTEATPVNLNSMNAGIWGLGADIKILPLKTPLRMRATMQADGTAGGEFSGVDELVDAVQDLDFDALAIQTPIECDPEVSNAYWKNGGVNPWGGIEAIVSKEIAQRINKPLAHAPVDTSWDDRSLYSELVVARSMAPEIISSTYTFCILKGLHRAPRLEFDLQAKDCLSNKDIDFLLTPHGCFGRPHWAAQQKGIPIIVVKENTTCFSKDFEYPTTDGVIFVENYLEAAGLIMSMSSGVDYRTVLA